MIQRTCSTRNRRASTMLLIVALIVILGTLSSIVLLRSLECYRVSARAERKLQLRAAAEGAAVLFEQSKNSSSLENLEIGRCLVRVIDSSIDTPRINVSLRGDRQEEIQSQRFDILSSNGRTCILEVMP